MAELPDVIGGEVISSDWGNDIRDRTIQRYADVAERSAEHPTPVDGDLSFLNSTGRVYVYSSGLWRTMYDDIEGAVGGAVRVDVDAESVVDTVVSTTYQTGATLTFTKPASWNTYDIYAWGTVTFDGTGGAPRGSARVLIVGVEGPNQAVSVGTLSFTVTANHKRGPLSDASGIVAIRYAELSGTVEKLQSSIQYFAVRKS